MPSGAHVSPVQKLKIASWQVSPGNDMTKYERFMAAVRHLQDCRTQNPRTAGEAAIDARRRAESDDGNDVARGMTGVGGEAISERNITLAAVRHALAHLPKHQRRMLILICVDGMSYKEAAEILDIPVAAMASQMARAREALHKQIASHFHAGVACTGTPTMSAWSGAARGEH
jgi:RNA polymerase sigma factor (sigma-70 family)